jgi:hypothetical protein
VHSGFARRDITFIFLPWQRCDRCFTCQPNQSVSNAIPPASRRCSWVIWSRSVIIQTIAPNSVMGRTNPYVSKEQEFAFFRFSFEAGTCYSLHHILVDPALNICHVYNPSNWTRLIHRCHACFRVQSCTRPPTHLPLEHQTTISLFVSGV